MSTGEGKKFRSGDTQTLFPVRPAKKWESRFFKQLIGGDIVGLREFTYRNGQIVCAVFRGDGLCFVISGDVNSQFEKMTKGRLCRQILGLTFAGGQPLYVAWPTEPTDNWPRVIWGEDQGKPYETIDHEHLSLVGNKPLYIATRSGQTMVVYGQTESTPWDRVDFPIQIVADQPLYRMRQGRRMFLVWGTHQSDPYDDISPPESDGKEITAWATKSLRIYKLTVKIG